MDGNIAVNGFTEMESAAMARMALLGNLEGLGTTSLELSGGRRFAVQATDLKNSQVLVDNGWGLLPSECAGRVFLTAFREITE